MYDVYLSLHPRMYFAIIWNLGFLCEYELVGFSWQYGFRPKISTVSIFVRLVRCDIVCCLILILPYYHVINTQLDFLFFWYKVLLLILVNGTCNYGYACSLTWI